VAHPADLHELVGLLFHPLGAVDHEDHAVDCRESAVGVLGEVLVAGGVEDAHEAARVLEAHDRGGHRDPALPLDLHEVGGGAAADLVGLHRSGFPDLAPKRRSFSVRVVFPASG